MQWLKDFLVNKLWPGLEKPLVEIILHFIITLLSILTIAGIDGVLHFIGLEGKRIPIIQVSLGDWMFWLEILAATAIIVVGIGKAIIALVRS